MSLKTNMFKKQFTETNLKSFQDELNKTLGAQIEVTIDMNSFDVDYGNGSVLEDDGVVLGFENNCFNPFLNVIKNMCNEEMMKDFLLNSLKKVSITNKTDQDTIYGYAQFQNGVFLFRAPAIVNTNGKYSKEIESLIFDVFNMAG